MLSSCSKEETTNDDLILDFTSEKMGNELYSFKIYDNGTVFLLQNDSIFKDYCKIDNIRAVLDVINKNNKFNYLSDGSVDGGVFVAVIPFVGGETTYRVNGNPKNNRLHELYKCIEELYVNYSMKNALDTTIVFSSLRQYIVEPDIDTSVNFLPPN